MGKPKNSQKRKNSSDGSSTQFTQLKTARNGGSPVNVSDALHRVNSVLYGDDSDSDESVILNNTVFEASISGDMSGTNDNNGDKTAPGSAKGEGTPPSNSDILQYLKQMDKKLYKLDSLEEKVSKFDSELKKLWVFVHGEFKENKDAMSKVTERIDGLEFSIGLAQEQITQMTNDKAKVNDTLLYVQSQSMRNNLIFTGITEDVNEKPDVTESKLRTFMVEKLKLARDIVDGFQLERAHRMGDNSSFGRAGRPRSIVAKFLRFKDREVVRQARSKLKGTGYFVNEQFPKEIADRRKELLPKMRQAIRDGKRAWISYDTLYIDGRPIRPESH